MSEKKTKKTPIYTKRAIDRYRADKKQISLIFTPEQWQMLNNCGINSGADVKRLLLDMIKEE